MVDIPNKRSLHVIPTPHGGGMAIVLTWFIGISVMYYWGMVEKSLYFPLICGVLLAIVSLIDDIIGLKPYIRLIVHFITATGAFYFLGGLRPLFIPGIDVDYQFLIYPFAVIGMVWFINLFNFMDGIDGFAALEAIIVCTVIFAFTSSMSAILLIACISGFLYWNWPKAKIFMGDVGSTQLGFILVVFGIYFHNTLKFSILNWIMLTSPFWFDATYTLYRRWKNGEKLSEAHKKHAYQRIVQAGFSHRKVNNYLILVNLIIVLMILIYREIKILQIPLFLLSLALYYLITQKVDKRVPFEKERRIKGLK
jgi:UDP-N-acetylmuramyl pentapeptide phosphotransferase/UDP-N-acetylglucosamine-1-phosphate transferase